jgi:hypothetical protein
LTEIINAACEPQCYINPSPDDPAEHQRDEGKSDGPAGDGQVPKRIVHRNGSPHARGAQQVLAEREVAVAKHEARRAEVEREEPDVGDHRRQRRAVVTHRRDERVVQHDVEDRGADRTEGDRPRLASVELVVHREAVEEHAVLPHDQHRQHRDCRPVAGIGHDLEDLGGEHQEGAGPRREDPHVVVEVALLHPGGGLAREVLVQERHVGVVERLVDAVQQVRDRHGEAVDPHGRRVVELLDDHLVRLGEDQERQPVEDERDGERQAEPPIRSGELGGTLPTGERDEQRHADRHVGKHVAEYTSPVGFDRRRDEEDQHDGERRRRHRDQDRDHEVAPSLLREDVAHVEEVHQEHAVALHHHADRCPRSNATKMPLHIHEMSSAAFIAISIFRIGVLS